MEIPLPRYLTELVSNDFKNCSNFNLIFNKFIDNWSSFNSYNAEKVGEYLQKISNHRAVPEYSYFINRWKELIKKLKPVKTFEMQTASRLAIGLGNETILENSMTLHHIYGVPYITGSALKGIFRAYYIEQCLVKCLPENLQKDKQIIDILIETTDAKNCLETDEKKAKKISYKSKSKEISIQNELAEYAGEDWLIRIEFARRIFGTQNNEGGLIFYDSYPLVFPKLKADIINNHFQKYYEKKQMAPGDWEQKLNINKFLTVDKGQKFFFVIGKRVGLSGKFEITDDEMDICFSAIKDCLKNKGAGAKTSVGYGYFKEGK